MAEKHYYRATKSDFDRFITNQEPSDSLKAATEAAAAAVNAGELELTEDDPIVIFEHTNTLRKTKPRPVTAGLVVESNRKLGPRKKKEGATVDVSVADPNTVASE